MFPQQASANITNIIISQAQSKVILKQTYGDSMNEEKEKLLSGYELYLKAKDYRERSTKGFTASARELLAYLDERRLNVNDLTINEAEEYREHMLLAPGKNGKARYMAVSVNNELSRARVFYGYLVAMKRCVKNSFEYIEKVKNASALPRNILSKDQMRTLLEGIVVTSKNEMHFKVVIELMYSTAVRINEVQSLDRNDIHPDESYMLIREDKTGSDRIVILTEYARELVRLYLKRESSEHPFGCRNLNALGKRINSRLRNLCRQLKITPITSHSIRHSIATHLIQNGADIREVQEILGHKDISNTEVYTRIFPEDLKNVVEKSHPRESHSDVRLREVSR